MSSNKAKCKGSTEIEWLWTKGWLCPALRTLKRQLNCSHRKLWWSSQGETLTCLLSVLKLFHMGCCWICKCMVNGILWCKILPIILSIQTHSFSFCFWLPQFSPQLLVLTELVLFDSACFIQPTKKIRCNWCLQKIGLSLDNSQKCTLFSTGGNWISGGCVSGCVSNGGIVSLAKTCSLLVIH